VKYNTWKIKNHIEKEYICKGVVERVNPTYDKKELYILTEKEWNYYQGLKKRGKGFIFYDVCG